MMAFSEFETHRYTKVVDAYIESKRPPAHIRKELDIGFRLEDQSIEIYEIRPAFRDPGKTMERPVAKTTFVKQSNTWKIFWQRADLKWHGYDPHPEADSLEEALQIIDADEVACFWG
jgi:hypothetical protein